MSQPQVIYLMGATATGKTALAVEIARRFPVEIISVDSALIYRGMDIGTAKPDAELLAQAPHFLIDIIDPVERYSAWDFVTAANQLIEQVIARGNIPLLVGGTMMYYHALENGLNALPEADSRIRARLDAQAQEIGWEGMHRKLALLDPQSAERLEPRDAQRIQRALEVFEISGETLTTLQQAPTQKTTYAALKIILKADDRALLHQRIETRFLQMLEQGFIDEVVGLKSRAELNLSLPSMRCVGYRQVWQYLDQQLSSEEMVATAIAATRQLAKRQITWLRKQPQELAFDCLYYQPEAIYTELELQFQGV